VVYFPDHEFTSALAFAIGAGFFTVDSIASIWMWRDEQFGLTFMSALNEFKPRANPAPRFSGRGYIFINIYCLISVMSVFNFCLQTWNMVQTPDMFSITRLFNEVMPLMIVTAVLVVHSAVVETPKSQPWHMLIMAARYLALAIGANAVTSFYLLIIEQEGPRPPQHDVSSNNVGFLRNWQ